MALLDFLFGSSAAGAIRGESKQAQFKVTFSYNYNWMEVIVPVRDTLSARRIVEAQYPGCKISSISHVF